MEWDTGLTVKQATEVEAMLRNALDSLGHVEEIVRARDFIVGHFEHGRMSIRLGTMTSRVYENR
jgi:hypothetical protein